MSTAVLITIIAGVAVGLVMLGSARDYCLRAERAAGRAGGSEREAGRYAGQARRAEEAAAGYAGQAGGAARVGPPPKPIPADGDTGEFPPLVTWRAAGGGEGRPSVDRPGGPAELR